MNTGHIVYNLTGRPLRARYSARANNESRDYEHDSVPLVGGVSIDTVPFVDGARQGELDNGMHDPAPSHLLPSRPACCVGCGSDLGEANARQYCAKTHCPFFA